MRLSERHQPEHPRSTPNNNGTDLANMNPNETDSPQLVEETTKPTPQRVGTILRNRNFLTLWGGQVFSQLADKIYLVLMIAIIESQFHSGDQSITGWVSAIMMANTIPAVLFGTLAGVFVDRWHKKEVLVITNLLRGLLVLGAPILLWFTKGQVLVNLPVGFEILLLITLLVSTLTQFFAPAEQATISMIVEKDQLLAANSLYTTTAMGSLIIGFAVGEPILGIVGDLFQHSGLPWNIGKELVVGGSYVLAGILLILLRTGETKEVPIGEPPHILADLRDGVDYLYKQKKVRGALLQLVILFSVFASMTVLAVRLAEILPEIKASQFGFLLAGGGAGIGLGAVLLGVFGKKFTHRQLAFFGSWGVAASFVLLSLFTNSFVFSLLSLMLLGVCGAIVSIPMQTTIQAETQEDMRGKVFGLQNNAVNIALSLPLALTGYAETKLGISTVLISLAVLVIGGGMLTWYWTADHD